MTAYLLRPNISRNEQHEAGGLRVVLFMVMAIIFLAFALPLSAQDDPPESTDENTYDEDTIVTEATDYLGEGAEGIAKAIEDIFKKNGRPNAYITGSEAGGGLVVGLRYGGGELHHKIEGTRPVHWTGPSVGFDVGANAVKTFALVYNIYDTEEMFGRIGAVEGSAYYVGGLGISAYGGGTKTVVMIRLGVGLRLQASLGYINFTKKRKIIPF